MTLERATGSFIRLDALEDHLEAALKNIENDQDRIHSIVAWSWF